MDVRVVRKQWNIRSEFKNCHVVYLPDNNSFSTSFNGNKIAYIVPDDGFAIGRDNRITPSDISFEVTDDVEITEVN